MLLREKGKKGGEPVSMGWDEAQAAIAAGTHVPDDQDGDGDPDNAGAPKPAAADRK